MEKLHKRNLIIVWCSVVALSLVSLMGYGFTVLAIRGIAILVVLRLDVTFRLTMRKKC